MEEQEKNILVEVEANLLGDGFNDESMTQAFISMVSNNIPPIDTFKYLITRYYFNKSSRIPLVIFEYKIVNDDTIEWKLSLDDCYHISHDTSIDDVLNAANLIRDSLPDNIKYDDDMCIIIVIFIASIPHVGSHLNRMIPTT